MDEQTLRQTLREIAQEELPETMNRWEDIKNQLPVTKTPNLRRVKRPTILLVAIVLILVSATAYAVFQSQQEGGLEGVREAGLTTEVGESQTIDDVTVKLNYAYADGSRIVVNYGVLVADSEGVMRPMDIRNFGSNGVQYRLLDAEHNLLIENTFDVSTDTNFDETTITASFNLDTTFSLPETLDFTLDMVFLQRPQPIPAIQRLSLGQLGAELVRMVRLLDVRTIDQNFPLTLGQMSRVFAIWFMPAPYTFVSMHSSGGGSFGMTINPEYTAEPQPLDIPAGGVGPFSYTFTVDVLPRTVVQPMVTIDVEGTIMTLEEVVIAPSKTELKVCYTEEPENYWYANPWEDVTLEIGDNVFKNPGYSGRGGGKKHPEYCVTYTFDVYTEGIPPSSLTLRINAFERSVVDPAEWQKIEEMINDPLIVSHNSETGSVSLNSSHPRYKEVLIELGYRIEGDWAFVVNIPQ